MPDPINHPPHYNSGPLHSSCGDPIECIDISETFTSNAGQALQYIWRHQLKRSPSEDLRKAAWFCLREAERLEGQL